MPAVYPHRYHLFAGAAGAPWVRGMFAQLGDGGAAAEALNCRVPLSPAADPTAAPVAWCSSFVCGDDSMRALTALADAGQIPAGVYWCRCDAMGPDEGTVRATNFAGAADRIGHVWHTPDALALIGLAFHRIA